MKCPNCEMRWADFPEADFVINEYGIHPQNDEAENKRRVKFDSDTIAYCGCIENDESEGVNNEL